MSTVRHWADVLELRPEVVARRGHAEGLQMSLYEAVYQTTDVPYRDATYWCDITEPTTKLVEFMADIARHLAGAGVAGQLLSGTSLYHLDQGMGGGKSHALVGVWHLAQHPEDFFRSDVGAQVRQVAEHRSGGTVERSGVRVVVLSADHFSPGTARPEFGPAVNLHQRFLWSLFNGDRALYDRHVGAGTDKAALKDAVVAAGQPVLILLDEVMDYTLALSAPEHRETMQAELAFLNALTGSVNELERTVMVVVMIRSDLDEAGYDERASEFREYLSSRLERNGTTVSVNEPGDFGAIIRRRVFSRPAAELPYVELAQAWVSNASSAWREHVFDKLPGARQLGGFAGRLERSYPFHPDLLDLVEHDWIQHTGFQRVRSTVETFATSAYWWVTERGDGRWAPEVIGVGDIPLHTAADDVLSSGLLHGNERQVVGMRQVAEKDISSADRTSGQAVIVDQRLTDGRNWADVQPQPAVRLATALWMYSVAVRAQGKRGATKAELLAAVYVPDERFAFGDAEEAFNVLTDDEDERGLGALDMIAGTGGGTPNRYALVTSLNKRMFQRHALARTTPDLSYELVWDRVRQLASGGSGFVTPVSVERPINPSATLVDLFGDIDQRRSNRLVVLDPRRWTLLNGRDSATRTDMEAMLGVGASAMHVDWAASLVVACVNTQRRDAMVKRARAAYAWQLATGEADPDSDLHAEMETERRRAVDQLDTEIRRSFQHYAHLVREASGVKAHFAKFDDDAKSSLTGNDVWNDLVQIGDAVAPATGLAGSYLHQLLDLSSRNYTLSEVVEKFWRDPSFPLIPSDSVARRGIFDALRPDDDGVAWELVTATGEPLAVTSPEQLLLNSSTQYLRLAQPASATPDEQPGPGPGDRLSPHTEGAEPVPGPGSGPGPEIRRGEAGGSPYLVHEMVLNNRSLTDRDARETLMRFLSELADVIDPTSGKDVQVVTIKVELNAAAGTLDGAEEKARAAGASWAAHREDF